jgi:pyruvate dehydrogenase E2 component (dihydrolipoamide acetyltransferase)
MAEFRMPSLGADMAAATLMEWKVKPGDRVRRGDIIAAVETDKGVIEIEVFEEGVIGELVVPVGEKVPVGEVLALIRAEGPPEQAPAVAEPAAESARHEEPRPAEPPPLVRASPSAR